MKFLLYTLEHFGVLSDTCKQELLGKVKSKVIEKGNMLTYSEETCNELYFIERGCLRGFYFKDSANITNWIHLDGMFATSSSFFTRTANHEAIEALETSSLLFINFKDLNELQSQFPEILHIRLLITEFYFAKLEAHLLMLRLQTAKQRYESLLKNESQLINRVPLFYIASYLGMTPVTLSRIRGQC